MMDDSFLEHMFGVQAGGGMFDMSGGAGGRAGSSQWDSYNVGAGAGKAFGVGGMGAGVLSKKGNEGVDYGLSDVQIRHHQQQQQQQTQNGGARGEGGSGALPVAREVRNGTAVHGDSLTRSLSLGSSASEDSGPQQGKGDQLMGSVVAPANHLQQPYGGAGSGVPPRPMNFSQAKAENVLLVGEMDSHNAQTLGKRFRDDDDGLARTTVSSCRCSNAGFCWSCYGVTCSLSGVVNFDSGASLYASSLIFVSKAGVVIIHLM
jgi:hypothetical protein